MTWLEAYGQDQEPTDAQMSAHVHNPLWEAAHAYMQEAYKSQPKRTFSSCSGQPGWNVKYQKGGKALCTLYPMDGFFIALIVVGEKERAEVELLLPTFTPYTQELYGRAGSLMGAKWLMMEIMDEAVLEDAKRIMAVRRQPK